MKILIIKLGALGDCIIATPVIRRILEHHSNDEVWLMTSAPFQKLFEQWPRLHVQSFSRKGFVNTLKQVTWIRQQHFDRIYDLQSNDRTSLLCALSGTTWRAGNHPRFPYQIHPQTEFTGQCHSFERLNQIIKAAGLPKAEAKAGLPVGQESVARVRLWLEQHKLADERYVLLHAGSSPQHEKKRWPYYAELAQRLAEDSYTTVWIGADDDAQVNKTLAQTTGVDATGKFSITELIELGKHAAFAITNDSAPMHILSCSDIPLFGLFGPTNPRRTHALGQEQRVIFAGDKLPDNDAEFVPHDIDSITVERVIDVLKAEGLTGSAAD